MNSFLFPPPSPFFVSFPIFGAGIETISIPPPGFFSLLLRMGEIVANSKFTEPVTDFLIEI